MLAIARALMTGPDLLLLELPPDSPLRAKIAVIQQSGKKAAAIVQDLLTLLHVICREDRYGLGEPEQLKILQRVAIALKLQETSALAGSVLIAMGEAQRPQPIRLGTTWITDDTGHKTDYQPVHLTAREFTQWLARKVRNLEDAPGRDKVRPLRRRGRLPRLPQEPPDMNQLIRLYEAVATPQQRRIMRLLHEGHSMAEIAAILHTTPNTVSVQWARLKQKLAQ